MEKWKRLDKMETKNWITEKLTRCYRWVTKVISVLINLTSNRPQVDDGCEDGGEEECRGAVLVQFDDNRKLVQHDECTR